MDLGSDTTASLVHSDELRALEQSFKISFQPFNCVSHPWSVDCIQHP